MSVADELKKFKELLDIGAITQEEFEKKKKELIYNNQESKQEDAQVKEESYNTANTNSTNQEVKAIIFMGIIFIVIVCLIIGMSGSSNNANTTNNSKNEVITNDPNAIYLSYETVKDSEYCVEYNLNGEKKMGCKIPSGTYKLEIIENNSMIQYDIFVEYDKIIKNSFGYYEQEPVLLIDLQENQTEITDYSKYYKTNNIADTMVSTHTNDNIIIEITDDIHLFLAIDTNIKLTKIN